MSNQALLTGRNAPQGDGSTLKTLLVGHAQHLGAGSSEAKSADVVVGVEAVLLGQSHGGHGQGHQSLNE